MKKNWKIFIVSHEKLYQKMYFYDKGFNNINYSIINVGKNDTVLNAGTLECVNQYDLVNSVKLGKWWAESEGIYNIWRSKTFLSYDFIGFIHYDYELKLRKSSCKDDFLSYQVTNLIDSKLEECNKDVCIGFESYNPKVDYNQKILADVNQPETLVGQGMNCYDYILADYNSFFHTNYTLNDFYDKKSVNLCSAFLMDTVHFDEMMHFWDSIVQSGKLMVFDTLHRHRLQGGLAERYFGVYMMFAYEYSHEIPLIHHAKEDLTPFF